MNRYATYDLTNLATLDRWPLLLTVVDSLGHEPVCGSRQKALASSSSPRFAAWLQVTKIRKVFLHHLRYNRTWKWAMQTIVIEQAKVELDLDQLVQAIKALDVQQRQVVRQALDADWSQELDEILANVRERFEAAPMTEAETGRSRPCCARRSKTRARPILVKRLSASI